MCKLTKGHGKKLIGIVERIYKKVATVSLLDTFAEAVQRQMIHHLGKYVFAGKHTDPFSNENE